MDENNNQQQFNQQGQFYQQSYAQPQYYQQPQPPKEEKASVGLAILSFFIPLAGLIIYCTQKDSKPKTAKVSGICALVSFIANIAISVIIMVTSGFLVGEAVDSVIDDPQSYFNEIGADTDNSEDTAVDGSTLGDYECVVSGAKIADDLSGRKIVVVTYEFTNNSSAAKSFDAVLTTSAYQDGIGLETSWLDEEDTDLWDVEIKPGVTKEVKKAYVLRDTTTDVEIEVEELFSFNDSKIVTTVKLA